MKKLMVIAAVALCAIGAQAATVDWNFTEVVRTDKPYDDIASYTAYFFTADAWSAVTKTAKDGAISADDFKGYLGSQGMQLATAATVKTYSVGGKQHATDSGLKATDAYYIVIADTETAGSSIWAKEFTGIQSYDESAEIPTPTDAAAWNISKVQTSSFLTSGNASYTVAGVPEPTSAMLLLLGVAGLALKRKRA